MNIQEKRSDISQLNPAEKSLILFLVSEGYAKRFISDNYMVSTSLIKQFDCLTAKDIVVKDGSYWNKVWSGEDYVMHLCGHKSGENHCLFDNGYDADNHLVHYEWTQEDCFKFALGLFERSYDLIMQSAIGSASYEDGIGYMRSKMNVEFIKSLSQGDVCNESVLNTILAKKAYLDNRKASNNDFSLNDDFDDMYDCSKEQTKLSLKNLMSEFEA